MVMVNAHAMIMELTEIKTKNSDKLFYDKQKQHFNTELKNTWLVFICMSFKIHK